MATGDPVELGVELVEKLEYDRLPLAAVIDRIETITSDPRLTRTILEETERRGIIERDGDVVHVRSRGFIRFESEVFTRDGEFSCQRCGTTLSTGYFIRLEAGELGPFGSSCIRRVTGRDGAPR